MTEYVEISPTARLAIEQDESPENPRGDWYMMTGAVTVDRRRGTIPVEPVHEPPIDIAQCYEHLQEYVETGSTPYDRLPFTGMKNIPEIVERWARIFHGLHIEWDQEHGCFWFVDPAGYDENWPGDALLAGVLTRLEAEAQIIKGERALYQRWADGEVYVVTLERAHTYYELDDRGTATDKSLTSWEEEDSLGGCYLDDEYSAQQVALEHFTLSDEETTALGGVLL